MIDAFGTSIPTSTTGVETRMSIFPFLKSVNVSSFSFAFNLPCKSPSFRFLKTIFNLLNFNSDASINIIISV